MVDSQGELVLLGSTSSTDLPFGLAPFSRQFRGGPAITPENGVNYAHGADGFLARFSAHGNYPPTAAGPGDHTITYSFNLHGVCGTGTLTVKVLGTALRTSPDTVLCGNPFRPFQLWATPAGGTWSGPGVSATGLFNPAAVFAGSSTLATPLYTFNSPDGCVSRRSIGIFLISDPPVLSRPALPGCVLWPGGVGFPPYTLTLPAVRPDNLSTYYWDFGDGQTSGYNPLETAHTYTNAGTFTPVLHIATNYQRGCSRTVALAPLVLGEAQPLPNIITPNADGRNDFFIQRQFCELPALRVFSRWGQEVYHTEHYRNDWAAPGLPEGTYYYRFVGE